MRVSKSKPVERTCARRLELAKQSMKTARSRLYDALGHKGFASDMPQIRFGVLRLFQELERLTPQLARLAHLQEKAERAARAARLHHPLPEGA